MCRKCLNQQKQGFIICEYCGVFLITQKEFAFEAQKYRPLFGSIKEIVKNTGTK